MASYKLLVKPSAAKELEALPKRDRQRIVTKIRSLSVEPRPPGCEKLSGHDLYRVRQGNYRVLYTVQDADLVVVVVTIGHRREVYR
ncbi:MAG: addiction module antitoxin [Armatimonadetes bacterium RBG_16_67_12]|nr:MAG: addiction module antitoxin [Armatimonadetes bacterium RBG_16_67_12]